ncbi:LysR family transcriptional regulator [Janthinobacterium agaricidamnosum]|uniref:Bacterial regulatory helix-turn-helix, lysR family protein n=1 Tax=Janthinobacterium agaricidamnosum NBRC 102515 = DSM 9628 TaxID=1349767 RepID=W0V505_9BURK|nr:LysR family transcriptional regulator [Janthinobacterium agaricidamnosum]CDG82931.1 bacterial regulatory helix-turn-helix, lysR family protein [Janthinobacterium agaricidamnosum NBRC 102515 = DSM 9628]
MDQLLFDLNDLQAMVAVVDQGGFRSAALALNISQPALSRRIAKLEQALNVQLFERTTRRVALTLVGREFFNKAQEILDGVQRSLHNISDISRSHYSQVTVACVPSVAHNFLPPILQRFHQHYPRIRIRIVDEGAHEVLNHVARGDADFGVNFLGEHEKGIDFEAIVLERFVLACLSDHPLSSRDAVTWDDIAQYPYMTVGKSSGNRMMLDQAMAPAERRPPSFIEVRHVTSLLEMVKARLGIAVVPQLALPHDNPSALRAVPLVDPEITRTLGIIRRTGRILSPGAQELYHMLKEALPEHERYPAFIRG